MRPPRGIASGAKRRQVATHLDHTGRSYQTATNDAIDRIVHRALNTEAGQELLTYLEGITLRTVLPVGASDAELREMEAQRRLVAMLKVRAKRTNDER